MDSYELTNEEAGMLIKYIAVCEEVESALRAVFRNTSAEVAIVTVCPIIERIMLPKELIERANALIVEAKKEK